MHWARRRRVGTAGSGLAVMFRSAAGVAKGPRRLVLCRVGPRRLDYDNLCGAYKSTVDHFVRQGVLTDDSPASGNTIEYFQIVGTPGTLVLLEESA